jgi:YidC/Oxa1 family membrane protein insertase
VGILNPFYEAVAWVLLRLHSLLGLAFGNSSGWSWALSIILLVILMRLILLPLFIKQMHAQRKMQALAPQVQALRKKYKNDKQTMNQEVMKLYQENGANPLAGCLPLVVQLPVFFALFNVLRAIAEDEPKYGISKAVLKTAQHAHILFATISDRIVTSPLPPYHLAPGSVSSKIEIGIVVLVSATTTFMTVRQSVKRGIGQPGQDPNNPMANSQKYMMYIAPLFALSGLYWQFGLVMYWVTTNLWTLGQQYVLFRNMAPITAGADAASATAPAAKGTGTAGPAGTTVSKATTTRSTSARGTAAKPAAKGTAVKGTAAKSGTASTSAAKAAAATTAKSGTKVSNGQSANGQSSSGQSSSGQSKSGQRNSGQRGSSQGGTSSSGRAQRTTTTSRPQAAKSTSGKPAETANGGERRGLGRLVRSSKPEPEPEPEVPATKLVRQQPVRQSRSKRSGKR